MVFLSVRNQFFHIINKFIQVSEKYSGIYSGRCFIIGNGPSINKQELTLLRNEYSFVSNRFILHQEFDKIYPSFYCLSDPDFLHKDHQNILVKIKDKITECSNFQLFTSNRFYFNPWFRKNFSNSNVNYIYFRSDKKVIEEKTISIDLEKGFYFGNTIVIDLCIPLAIMMGFDEIILLGCDLKYSENNSHFFGHQKGTENKAKDISRIQWISEVDESYGICNEYAMSRGVKLLDATSGGEISTLEKIEYLKLF